MAKTIEQLKAQGAEVKNATAVGENTATRVGTLFTDIVEHVEEYETGQTANTEANATAIKDSIKKNEEQDQRLSELTAQLSAFSDEVDCSRVIEAYLDDIGVPIYVQLIKNHPSAGNDVWIRKNKSIAVDSNIVGVSGGFDNSGVGIEVVEIKPFGSSGFHGKLIVNWDNVPQSGSGASYGVVSNSAFNANAYVLEKNKNLYALSKINEESSSYHSFSNEKDRLKIIEAYFQYKSHNPLYVQLIKNHKSLGTQIWVRTDNVKINDTSSVIGAGGTSMYTPQGVELVEINDFQNHGFHGYVLVNWDNVEDSTASEYGIITSQPTNNNVFNEGFNPFISANKSRYNGITKIVKGLWLGDGVLQGTGGFRSVSPILIPKSGKLYFNFGNHTKHLKVWFVYFNENGNVISTPFTPFSPDYNGCIELPNLPSDARSVALDFGIDDNVIYDISIERTSFFMNGKVLYDPFIREVTVSAISPNADYKTITELFANEGAGELIIHLLNEFYSAGNIALIVPDGWHFKGAGKDNTKFLYYTDGEFTEEVGKSGLLCQSNCSFEDMTLQARDTSNYALHIECYYNGSVYDILVKNCKLEKLAPTISAFEEKSDVSGSALGIGIGNGQHIRIEGCDIIPQPTSTDMSEVGLNLHNWDGQDYPNEPAEIVFENCNIYGHYSAVITNFKSNNVNDRFDFLNCNLYGGMLFMNAHATSKVHAIKLNLTGSYCPIFDNGNYEDTSIIEYPEISSIIKVKNVGDTPILAYRPVSYVFAAKKPHWNVAAQTMAVGISNISSDNQKNYAGVAVQDIAVGEIGAVQISGILPIWREGKSIVIGDYIAISNGDYVVDNSNPHPIGKVVGTSSYLAYIEAK